MESLIPAQPWERQPGESAQAFEAFRVFRDLGPNRTVRDAYRQARGKPDASQASGTWLGWVSKYGWTNRARRYDAHLESERLRAIEQAERARVAEWIERRSKSLEARYQAAEAGLARARELLRFPVHQVRTESGGQITIIEPLSADLLRKIITAAREAGAMSADVIRDALALVEYPKAAATQVDPEARRMVLDQAAQELSEWQQGMVAQIQAHLASLETPGAPPALQPV